MHSLVHPRDADVANTVEGDMPCVSCGIRTGVTEHHQSDSAAVQCFLRGVACQRSDVSSCGPLVAGPRCGVDRPGLARSWTVEMLVVGVRNWWGPPLKSGRMLEQKKKKKKKKKRRKRKKER